MTSNQYHFVTHWRVEGTCGEVADILGDPLSFPRWWPSVYLDVRETAPPGPDGLGRRIALVTKGWLPYTIRWEFDVVESRYPYGFAIAAAGDFDGRGVWTFEQAGPLRRHHLRLAAARGETAAARAVLSAETAVRIEPPVGDGAGRAESAAGAVTPPRDVGGGARGASPPPPGPVTYSALAVLGAAALAGGAVAYLIVRARKRRQ